MTQATALFELYKHLPERERHKFRGLLVGEIDDVSVLEQIKDGIREIKAIRQGKAQAKDLDELLNEMRNERKDKSPIAL